jgi:hypothetical protein
VFEGKKYASPLEGVPGIDLDTNVSWLCVCVCVCVCGGGGEGGAGARGAGIYDTRASSPNIRHTHIEAYVLL